MVNQLVQDIFDEASPEPGSPEVHPARTVLASIRDRFAYVAFNPLWYDHVRECKKCQGDTLTLPDEATLRTEYEARKAGVRR